MSSAITNDKMDSETQMNVNDLPLEFKCKYLGSQNARGLWGIKHTRRPVDHLVSLAKNLTSNRQLSFCNLTVDKDGVHLEQLSSGSPVTTKLERIHWTIDTISYGVQDLVYTRVFAMIVVKEDVQVKNDNLFEVHAFVCDSRHQARRLTYALAAAFQEYSRIIKLSEDNHTHNNNQTTTKMKSRFAIDLRTPEELHQEHETEA